MKYKYIRNNVSKEGAHDSFFKAEFFLKNILSMNPDDFLKNKNILIEKKED